MELALKNSILSQCNAQCKNTLMETLNIEFIDVGNDFITAKMPVNSSVYQPDGVLHGGATIALAETVGSVACYLFVDNKEFMVRGLELNANHLKSVKTGEVFATARPIHKGKTTQLWQVTVTDSNDNVISLVKISSIALVESNQWDIQILF